MKLAFVAISVILIFVMGIVANLVYKKKNELTKVLFQLIMAAIITLSMDIIGSALTDEKISAMFFAMFFASIDWLLMYFGKFVFVYTEVGGAIDNKSNIVVKNIVRGIVILDSISMLSNIILGNVFSVTTEVFYGDVFSKAYDFTVLYKIHLGISYLMVLWIFLVMIMTMVKNSKFYRKKYSIITFCFFVLIVLDGLTMVFSAPFNYSFIFYGITTIAIAFFTLRYIPNGMLTNMLTMIMKNINVGIICFDNKGKMAYSNNILWSMLGIPEDVEAFNNFKHENLFDGDSSQISVKVNGEMCYFSTEKVEMMDGSHLVGIYYTFADITDKVRAMTQRVDEANAKNMAKTQFLSHISHEIRTPVNSIYGMNEMILREAQETDIKNYSYDIKTSTEILIGIINDVLDFSKIEAGKMEIVNSRYSIKDSLNHVINMIKIKADDKNLSFDIDISPKIPMYLIGDSVRIVQVIINLLTNAVKYTSEGFVKLRVDVKTKGDKAVLYFEVSDSGMGIKQEDIPKLFTAYERIEETRNHSIQGTGLGLNITDKILRLMDSRLDVKSIYGKGSTFSFLIEQQIDGEELLGDYNPYENRVIQEYKANIIAPNAKILMVDDNAINRKVFCNLLKKTQIKIHAVDSGAKCLELITRNKYDLIFLDHMMPEMDGIETFDNMKKLEHNLNVDTPVIMLTANATSEARDGYMRLGFDGFLAKPIIPDELEGMLISYIGEGNGQ